MQLYRFEPESVAATYRTVGFQVVEMVDTISPDLWDTKGLGGWDVRTLVAHIMRSFTGVTKYLAAGEGAQIELVGPISYYTTAFARIPSVAEIDRRAVEEAAALGDDVAGQFKANYEAAVAAVEAASSEAPVKSPVGVVSLADYLPSRVVELVVHGEDLKAATGIEKTFDAAAIEVAAIMCGSTAAHRGIGVEAVLALTGRRPLPSGFDVLGFE